MTKNQYTMVADFEPHESSYMIWPERRDNWRMGAKYAQDVYVKIAKIISESEPITMLVSKRQYLNAREQLPKNIRVVEMSNDDAWIRDTGPIFIRKGKEIKGLDFKFNAWGGLFDGLLFPWDQDDLLASKICELLEMDFERFDDFVLEGSSILTDGEGTLFTTKECLLSEGRNPSYTKEMIEEKLKETLGVKKIIWFKKGHVQDEANGTIDHILSVIRPGEVLLSWTDDSEHLMYDIVQDSYATLKNNLDAQGRKFKIHKIPFPPLQYRLEEESCGIDPVNSLLPRNDGMLMPASYTNYYITNDIVIFPMYKCESDQEAEKILMNLYPEKKVIGVAAREILLGGGNIHHIALGIPSRSK